MSDDTQNVFMAPRAPDRECARFVFWKQEKKPVKAYPSPTGQGQQGCVTTPRAIGDVYIPSRAVRQPPRDPAVLRRKAVSVVMSEWI